MKFLKTGLVASLVVLSMAASAAQWSTTSLSYLNGNGFEYGDNNKDELSFEHASGFAYGDNFFFFDVTDAQAKDSNNYEIYGEWAPRLSLGKIFGYYNRDRILQDVLLAGAMEFGSARDLPVDANNTIHIATRTRLYGVGFDFKIPYFAFFNYNFYVRDNIDKEGTTFQSTITYLVPIKINDKFQFSWGAYIDYVHGEEGAKSTFDLAESHWHTAQQVLMDVGALWGKPGVLQAGMEYQYWNRKYGLSIGDDGAVENNAKWMVKWIF